MTTRARALFGLVALVAALAWPIADGTAGGVDGPTALAGSGRSVWVADTSGDVRRLDASTRAVRGTAHVDGYVDALALDRQSVWASTIQPNTLVRIDRTTNRRVGPPIDLGNGQPIDVADDGQTLWVVESGSDRVWRFDARSGRARGSTVVSADPWLQVSVAADARGAWVAFSSSATASSLVRIDRRGRIVVRRQVPGIEIAAVALTDDTLLAVGGYRGRLLRRDARTGARTGPPIAVGRDPIALAVGAGVVWISSLDERRAIRGVDLQSGRTVVGPVRAPGRQGRADDLALAGGYLWATNAYGTLSRLALGSGRARGAPLRVP